jgi:biotin carboxylase
MHVVMVGAKKAAMDALLSVGHAVTILYEAWEDARVLPLRALARHCCAVNSSNCVESLWSALHQLGALDDGVDAVVATSEVSVMSAAVLGKLLGARAIAPEVALRCRDKAVQKSVWHASGVPTAKFAVIPDAAACPGAVSKAIAECGLLPPFFVKPTAAYGARGVRCAANPAELTRVVAESVRAAPAMRRLMIEEHVEGDEWHFDGVLIDGRLDAFCVSRYLTPVFQAKMRNAIASVCLPPHTHPALYEAARSLATRAVAALGHRNGVFHLEAFCKPGTLNFVAGELAARVGGNAISESITRTVGVDPWVAAALTITGDEIPRRAVELGAVYGMVSLPATAGCDNRVRAEDITSVPGVAQVLGLMPYGSIMPDMVETSSSCIGFALVQGSSVEACEGSMRAAAARALEINDGCAPSVSRGHEGACAPGPAQ